MPRVTCIEVVTCDILFVDPRISCPKVTQEGKRLSTPHLGTVGACPARPADGAVALFIGPPGPTRENKDQESGEGGVMPRPLLGPWQRRPRPRLLHLWSPPPCPRQAHGNKREGGKWGQGRSTQAVHSSLFPRLSSESTYCLYHWMVGARNPTTGAHSLQLSRIRLVATTQVQGSAHRALYCVISTILLNNKNSTE